MKYRLLNLRMFSVLLCTVLTQAVHAQTHRIMPVGNSITPGYIDILHTKLNSAGIAHQFVGEIGSSPDVGFYYSGAKIKNFLSGQLHDITTELNLRTPEVVILEIGTDDIGAGTPMDTIKAQYHDLVKSIVQNSNVQHLLLCKVIPKLTSNGDYEDSKAFNKAIDVMLAGADFSTAKIDLIDLFTPFDANQLTYYTNDEINPSYNGYDQMAEIFSRHLQKLFIQHITDYFARATLQDSGWVATAGIRTVQISGTYTAMELATTSSNIWGNLALWKTSKGFSTVSMQFNASATTTDLDGVGIAVALDDSTTSANGYLIFIHGNYAIAYTIVGGAAGAEVSRTPMSALAPGDVLKVSYKQGSDANVFSVSVNNGTPVSLQDTHKLRGNGTNLYSGVLFEGSGSGVLNQPIDWFQVDSQLPDNVAPGAPTPFGYITTANTSVLMNWNAPGSDGYGGEPASSYDIRYSTQHITTETDFINANIPSGLKNFRPGIPGSVEQFTLTGLVPGTQYYIRMRAIDSWGNKGDLSDEITVTTTATGNFTDNFNRTALGSDWVFNPAEHRIDSTYTSQGAWVKEFTDYGSDQNWGQVAIFRGRTNPSMVSLTWGDTTTAKFQGINQGGLALMLADTNIATTSGYLIWIHQQPDSKYWIYLYGINNGIPNIQLDGTLYNLTRFPQHGDKMSVSLNWQDTTAYTFDVYVNNVRAGRTLFAPYKQPPSTLYSGILLSRMNGQNNVAQFSTYSNYSQPDTTASHKAIGIYSQPTSGVVGTTLTSQPLQIIFRDQNNTPLSGLPVWFWVASPSDASVDSPPRAVDPIHIEAEWDPSPVGTYVMATDALASGGKYMTSATGEGTLNYNFFVETDGTYYIYGRTITTDIRHMAVEVKLDDQFWVWNANSSNFSTDWQWGAVSNQGGAAASKRLTRGLHHLQILKLHDNVKIDQFIITATPNLHYTGKQEPTIRLTDANGVAGTILTLGKKAGPNRVIARPFDTADSVEIVVNALASAPTRMTKNHDNQTGAARTTLDSAFVVTLFDANNNKVPGVQVRFKITKGSDDGTLAATHAVGPADSLIVTSDSTGQASAYLTLGMGTVDSVYTVRASLPGYSAVLPMDFTSSISTGRVKQIVVLSPNQFPADTCSINDVLNQFLRVLVKDDSARGVDSIKVRFAVTAGNATVDTLVTTDTSGYANSTLRFGSTAGIVTVTARAGGFQKVVISDSVFYRAGSLEYWSGDGAKTAIGDTLKDTLLKVRVKDRSGAKLPNHPVTFITRNRNGSSFHFPLPNGAYSDSITVMSNPSGLASTNVRVDTIDGFYSDIVEARSTNGFTQIARSPVSFSLISVSSAAQLKLIKGTGQQGVVHERADSLLVVQLVDNKGIPVRYQPVLFTRLSATGQFDGTTADSIVELTDKDGFVEVVYYFGSVAGTGSDSIRVDATNGYPSQPCWGSPAWFILSARSTKAKSISVYPDSSALTRTGIAGRPLVDKVMVQIRDDLGNPVSGQVVNFRVTDGGGSLNGTGLTVVTDTVKNALGVAAMDWTLGTHAGTGTNKLEVTAGNGIVSLAGSPVRFTASVTADSVSPTHSLIEASGPTKSTLEDTCWITVTLMDKYDNPVSGKIVGLTVEGKKQNLYPQQIGPTNASGKARGYLLSNASGVKTISAVDATDNVPLTVKAATTFLSNNAFEIAFDSLSQFIGNIGTILTDSLVIEINDLNGNPVAYSSARFEVTRGGGRLMEPQPVVSDTNGLAWVHLMLGPEPGENTVQAIAVNAAGVALKNSPLTFTATGRTATATSMKSVGDLTQSGRAGEELSKPFVVAVIDLNGRPVFNVPVYFTVESGNAALISSDTVMTDAYGYAYADVRAGTSVGASVIKGFNNTLTNSPSRFTVNTVPGPARDLQYVSGGDQAGHVNQAVPNPLTVKAVDAYGNPVSGVLVKYTVVSGDAWISGNKTMTALPTVSSGVTYMIVTMGQNGGPVRVEATNPELGGSPVVFNLTFSPLEPDSMIKILGDNQKVTFNQTLVDPISVLLVDAHGIPVPGISIKFTLEAGTGQLLGIGAGSTGTATSQTVYSNAQGIAAVQYRAGSSPEISKVTALWLTKTLSFTLETVQNYHFPVLDKASLRISFNTPTGWAVFESQTLGQTPNLIPLVATDDDNDPLQFQVYEADSLLSAPAGAVISMQSLTTALFRWATGYDQSGTYSLVFRVTDGKGGYDADTVQVKVANLNRPPVIQSTIPTADSTVYNGVSIRFFVQATDADRDVLHYRWKVGNTNQPGDAPVFEYKFDKNFTGSATVTVMVDDGTASTQASWNIQVMTAVEMSRFAAAFNAETRKMEILWQTSREVGNIGFDVYRGLSENGDYVKLNSEFIRSRDDGRYVFEDDSVKAGIIYFYKIMDLDADGGRQSYGPLTASVPLPKRFEMSQNYPNPFNPNTEIRYALPKSERVTLSIFNLMGQEVARIVDKVQEAGFYTVSWNGRDQNGRQTATGIYLYRLRGDRDTITRRMVKMQ